MTKIQRIWSAIKYLIEDNIHWIILVVLAVCSIGMLVLFDRQRESDKKEFISWCKLEYDNRGHKDIDKYCYYLYIRKGGLG